MMPGVAPGQRTKCPSLLVHHLLQWWPSPLFGMSEPPKGWGLIWEVVMEYEVNPELVGVFLLSVLKEHTAMAPAKGRRVHSGVQCVVSIC